MDNFNTHY